MRVSSQFRYCLGYKGLTIKEGSTFHLGLLLLGKKRETAPPRRSEPLRSKVGGASKPSPYFAGWDRQAVAGET